MWIIAKHGFISLVQDRKDHNMLQVRARVQEDIEQLLPGAVVFTKDGADYRYRARVTKVEVAQMMAQQVLDIDYDSHFKDEAIAADKKHNATRRSAYYGCWSALAKLQDWAPYARMSRTEEDKRYPRRWDTGRDVKATGRSPYSYDYDNSLFSYSDGRWSDFAAEAREAWTRTSAREAAREPEVWDRERPIDVDYPDDDEAEDMFTTDELAGVEDAFGVEPSTLDWEVLDSMVSQLHRMHYFDRAAAPEVSQDDDDEMFAQVDRDSRSINRSKGKRAAKRRYRTRGGSGRAK